MYNGVGVWKGSRRDWISRNKQALRWRMVVKVTIGHMDGVGRGV